MADKSLKEIADKYGVAAGKLNLILWRARIEGSGYQYYKGRVYKMFDSDSQRRIGEYIKKHPFQKQAGRPRKTKKERG